MVRPVPIVSNHAQGNAVPVPMIPHMFHQGMRNAANRAGLPPPLPTLPRISKPRVTKLPLTLLDKWEDEAWDRANKPARRPISFVRAKLESQVDYNSAIQKWEFNTGRRASVDEKRQRALEATVNPNRVTFGNVSGGGERTGQLPDTKRWGGGK